MFSIIVAILEEKNHVQMIHAMCWQLFKVDCHFDYHLEFHCHFDYMLDAIGLRTNFVLKTPYYGTHGTQ
jgi:hypothetical protein